MTTVSKCLVVFAVAVSLAFLGFASAVLQGGPNYQSQLKDPMLNGYVFETTKVTEDTKDLKAGTAIYSVKTRRPKQAADGTWAEEVLEKDSPVLSKVIIAARNHLNSQQEAELQRIREGDKDGDGPEVLGIEELKVEIQRAITEINEDKLAFQRRETLLTTELQTIQKAISDVTETSQNETAKAAKLQISATRRREDVLRLENQLKEIETDLFRAEQQREKLEDLLIRVQSKVQRLKRRNKQLKY